jgi:class 3 adenylate cyclase/tetratricopeptide (TPR) repeat protein
MDRRQAMLRGEALPERTGGAALFADISGFTPLTERLARGLGARRGAEELSRQLNAVYGALIAEVHGCRGSVIGFSGDAITCWFDGDTGRRAAACALAMQQAMRPFEQIQVSPGAAAALAVKVAVAAGPVRRLLVGEPEIQIVDVLAGATLDRLAALERQAAKGEVVLDAQTAAGLGDGVRVAGWRGGTCAVVETLTPPVEPAPWPDLVPEATGIMREQARPWLLPPVYERLQAGQGRFLAEIRPAAPLFLKFGGIDYDRDEAAGAKLDAFIRRVQRVLARYEGHLIQLTTGDKGSYLYAIFGAPIAHDDDAARAAAAALEMRALPPDLGFIAGVQIGLSQGRMWAGAYGSSTRCTYGVLGDQVNLAARLMEMARPGQVMATQSIADAAGKRYRFQPAGAAQVKGRRAPVAVFTLHDRRLPSTQGPAGLFSQPLVGRNQELELLERLLQSARSGDGQILRLAGPAGIGKSRLAAELIERGLARGFRAALGMCQSDSQDIAYYPWRSAFSAVLGIYEAAGEGEDPATGSGEPTSHVRTLVERMNPDWLARLPLLGDLLGLPIRDNETTAALSPELRQRSLFALVTDVLHAAARSRPLLLLLEDVQWMDEASRELALTLARSIARLPVLVVVVHRVPAGEERRPLPELDRLPFHTHVYLPELASAEVSSLAARRLQGDLSAPALSLVQVLAQGNPFFTEELIDSLRESKHLRRGEGGAWTLSKSLMDTLRNANCLARSNGDWVVAEDAPLSTLDLGVPDTIAGAVLSRIDRLPETDKLTLKIASVIGHTFRFELLHRSHPTQPGQEALLRQVRMMEARDLIRLEAAGPQQAYAFKHHIIEEVAYGTLPDDQRRELHGAVARAMEGLAPGEIERLAYHYYRGDVRQKAVWYLDQAAGKAQREYANQTALNYYNQALGLEERPQWLKGKVEVLHILGRREEEHEALRSLETIAQAPVSDVAYLWGRYYEAGGDYDRAHDAVEQAIRALHDRGDLAGEARCLARLGSIARRRGELDGAREWYEDALASLGEEHAYPDIQIQALNGLGFVHRQQGNYELARTCYARALALSRSSGNRAEEGQALNDLGVTAFYQRRLEEARTHHRQALEIRRAIGDRAGEGASLGNLAQVTRDAGDYGQARAYLSGALAIQQSVDNRWDEANIWNDMGVIYLLAGDLEEARVCFEKALGLSREIGAEGIRAYFLGNLGLLVRDLGDLGEAERLLAEGLALAEKQGDRHLISLFVSHLGIVSLLEGRPGQAIERARQALTMRRELGLQAWTTADLTTLASAYLGSGETATALDYARQALAILDEGGAEGAEYPHRDYFVCYQVLAATGQPAAAYAALEAAYRLVTAQAGKIAEPDLRRSFLERVDINRAIVREYQNVKREA